MIFGISSDLALALVAPLRYQWVTFDLVASDYVPKYKRSNVNPRIFILSPNRPIPDEATRVRIISGNLDEKDDDPADDCMGGSESECSEVGSAFSQFENSESESADNMSLTSDDGGVE